MALISPKRLYFHSALECEQIHLLLIDDTSKGLADVAAGTCR